MENVYIHYSHKKFDPELFNEIKNIDFVKPLGGLWACNINTAYGWKEWCGDNDFDDCKDETNSFKFKLKNNAKVLIIDDIGILEVLPKIDKPIISRLDFLDFEKIREEYDAIELLISVDRKLYYALYGWDIDSILIMNKDIVEVIG